MGDDTSLNGDASLVGVRPFQMSRLPSVTGKAVVSVDLCSGEGSVRVHGASACLHLDQSVIRTAGGAVSRPHYCPPSNQEFILKKKNKNCSKFRSPI